MAGWERSLISRDGWVRQKHERDILLSEKETWIGKTAGEERSISKKDGRWERNLSRKNCWVRKTYRRKYGRGRKKPE
jgi:hypothetical protein